MLLVVAGICASASGQLEEDRRSALEARRDALAARVAEIDAELAGEVPAGTVRLFGWQRGEDAPPPPDGWRRGDEQANQAPPDERGAWLERLSASDPELGRLVSAAIERRGDRAGPIVGRMRELVDLRDTDPEAFEIRKREILAGLEVLRLAGELRDLFADDAASEEAITDAEARLREAVEAGFDAKKAVLESEIERSADRIDEMQQRLSRANEQRESIIDEQFQRLLERIRRGADHGRHTPRERLRDDRTRGDR